MPTRQDISKNTARDTFRRHGSALKIWDARTGLLLSENVLGTGAAIAGLEFDARGRRFICADRGGVVNVRRTRDAMELMHLGKHRAEVSAMCYCRFDRVVVTVGWDRALHVPADRAGTFSPERRSEPLPAPTRDTKISLRNNVQSHARAAKNTKKRIAQVYDELEDNPDDALLRATANAHDADVMCVARCRD